MLVNLTPHNLNIECANGEFIELSPSGTVARIKTESVWRDRIKEELGDRDHRISIFAVEYGEIENLPERVEGTKYIVSALVAERAKRGDVLSPGELIRNEDGQPIGCRGLTAHT